MQENFERERKEACKILADSERSLDRTLALINQSKELGTKTLATLNTQDEQLDNMIEAHKDIKKVINRAEEQLNVIEHGLFGRVANFFKRLFSRLLHRLTGHHKKTEEKIREVEHKDHEELQAEIPPDSSKLILDKMIKKDVVEVLDLPPEENKRIDRIAEKLDLLQDGISDLRQQALTIGQILDEQNERKLPKLIKVTDENQSAIQHVDHRTCLNIS